MSVYPLDLRGGVGPVRGSVRNGVRLRPRASVSFNRGVNAGRFFRFDTAQARVGTAQYRATRRMAFYVRKVARNSMKKGGRYTSPQQMPETLRKRYYAQQTRYEQGRTKTPAYLPARPSRPGQPPFYREGNLRNPPFGVFAEPGPGVTPASLESTFLVGPLRMPGGKNNRGRAQILHEYGGPGEGSSGAVVVFPKRPYMAPALKKSVGRFQEFLQKALAEDLGG